MWTPRRLAFVSAVVIVVEQVSRDFDFLGGGINDLDDEFFCSGLGRKCGFECTVSLGDGLRMTDRRLVEKTDYGTCGNQHCHESACHESESDELQSPTSLCAKYCIESHVRPYVPVDAKTDAPKLLT